MTAEQRERITYLQSETERLASVAWDVGLNMQGIAPAVIDATLDAACKLKRAGQAFEDIVSPPAKND